MSARGSAPMFAALSAGALAAAALAACRAAPAEKLARPQQRTMPRTPCTLPVFDRGSLADIPLPAPAQVPIFAHGAAMFPPRPPDPSPHRLRTRDAAAIAGNRALARGDLDGAVERYASVLGFIDVGPLADHARLGRARSRILLGELDAAVFADLDRAAESSDRALAAEAVVALVDAHARLQSARSALAELGGRFVRRDDELIARLFWAYRDVGKDTDAGLLLREYARSAPRSVYCDDLAESLDLAPALEQSLTRDELSVCPYLRTPSVEALLAAAERADAGLSPHTAGEVVDAWRQFGAASRNQDDWVMAEHNAARALLVIAEARVVDREAWLAVVDTVLDPQVRSAALGNARVIEAFETRWTAARDACE